ncbi:MAG: cupredoxin domain-containing protein [Chloroflexi bacterium]|nr:cupredoxin domain-containing protein [Chloroflexota bacterium]
MTVAKGKTVKFTITSRDTSHTFTIAELGINIAVDAGQTVTRELKVEKAGTFAFYCAVPGHRSAGMAGTLTVTNGEASQAPTPAPTPAPPASTDNASDGGGYDY